MNSTLTRLFGQAEINLADLSRRAVASVTEPIKVKGQELAAETLEAVLAVVKTVAIKAVLGLVAVAMLLVAIGYAAGALYAVLVEHWGPVAAGLIMAGGFVVIAVIAILLLVFWPTSTRAAQKAARAASAEVGTQASKGADAARQVASETRTATRKASEAAALQAAAAEAGAAAAPPLDLKESFDTVVAALGDAGFRREQAGLRAGLALASQLKPMQIVSLALIGGFIAATRFPGRR